MDHDVGWTNDMVNANNQARIYAIINSEWDLIIIDKAHRVAGSSSDVARYNLYDAWGERRLDATYSKYFLTVFRETPKTLAAFVMLLQYFSHTCTTWRRMASSRLSGIPSSTFG